MYNEWVGDGWSQYEIGRCVVKGLVLRDMDGGVCTVEDLGDFHGESEVLVRSRHGVILRAKDAAILRDWLTQWIEEQEVKGAGKEVVDL